MTNLQVFNTVAIYSCLVVLIFAFTVIFQSMTTPANAGAPLYSCTAGSVDDDTLFSSSS